MNKTHDERRGATSASNAQADLLCPGRHQAQKGIPDEASADAQRGRRIHEALAQHNQMKRYVGARESLSPDEHEMYEMCREDEKKLVAQFFNGMPLQNIGPSRDKVWREERYWVRVPPENFEHSGQADVVFRRSDAALIVDYKTLRGSVPSSSRNLQLRDLAVLVRGNLLVKRVGVAIIQPEVSRSPELVVYEKEDLDRAAREMFDRVRLSNAPMAMRVPGPEQCKYCKAKSKCVEYQTYARSMLPAVSIVDKPLAEWTPVEFGMFLERKSVAQDWLDAAYAAAKKLLKEGGSIPGWLLSEGRKTQRVVDPSGVFQRFVALGGTQEQFVKAVNIGKEKFKAVLADLTQTKGRQVDKHWEDCVAGFTETTVSEPSIAREKETL